MEVFISRITPFAKSRKWLPQTRVMRSTWTLSSLLAIVIWHFDRRDRRSCCPEAEKSLFNFGFQVRLSLYCFGTLYLRPSTRLTEIPVASSRSVLGSGTGVGGMPGGGGVSGGGGINGTPGGTGFAGGGLCKGWDGDPPPKMIGTMGGRKPPWSDPGGADSGPAGLEPAHGAKGLSDGKDRPSGSGVSSSAIVGSFESTGLTAVSEIRLPQRVRAE